MAKNRKKRKVKIGRLLIVLGIFLILIALIVGMIYKIYKFIDHKINWENRVSVTLTGDLLYEQGLYDSMDNYSFGTYLDEIKPYFDDDITIANQEVPIGGAELGVSGVAYTFNAPYEIANQYPEIGIDYVTNATNHTMDMGLQGIQNTNNILDQNNIKHTGGFTSQESRDEISIVGLNGIKIAILAYTYGTNIPAYNNYDVNYFLSPYGEFDADHQLLLTNDVARAKEVADVVFVAMHWGTEFTYELDDAQRQVSHFLNDLGVDVIIGNHPHTIQGAETLTNAEGKNTYVFYSLGNFISSAALVDRASPDFQNMYEIGALAQFDVVQTKKGITFEDISIIPIVNHFESNYTNFKMIPFSSYTEEMVSHHYQKEFNSDFNVNWLSNQIHSVFDSSGFNIK